MKKKFLFLTLFAFLLISLCSYSFAATNMMNSAKNTVMNAGNAISNAATSTMNAIGNGARDIVNGTETLGNDAINSAEKMDSDAMGNFDNAVSTLGTDSSDYIAERTASTSNLLGFSNTTWTWLILGVVGIAIVALVWYYGAQYDHRDYSND